MGDPRKLSNKYDTPKKPWDKERIGEEAELMQTYGLKNKRELWTIETFLRKKRQNARKLLSLELEERAKREKELMDNLQKIGLTKGKASLDDVLGLKIQEILERRLQTIVWRKNLANTAKQARQFITHGHISVNGKRVSVPGYVVLADEENSVGFYKGKKILTEQKKPKKRKKEEEKKEAEEEPTKEAEKTSKEVKKDFEEVAEAAKKAEKEAEPKEKTMEKEKKPEEAKKEAKGPEKKETPGKGKKEESPKEKKGSGEKGKVKENAR